MAEIHMLASGEGVRWVGERWGYEWLPGLSHGVQRELNRRLHQSALEVFLRDEHGFKSATVMNMNYLTAERPAGPPSEEILEEFAERHGRMIREWSLNAFNMIE